MRCNQGGLPESHVLPEGRIYDGDCGGLGSLTDSAVSDVQERAL